MQKSGVIKEIFPTQVIKSGRFKKRELVLSTTELYPTTLLIQFINNDCDLLKEFKTNQNVTVSIKIKGNELQFPDGTTKYYNTIQGVKVELQPYKKKYSTQSDYICIIPPYIQNDSSIST